MGLPSCMTALAMLANLPLLTAFPLENLDRELNTPQPRAAKYSVVQVDGGSAGADPTPNVPAPIVTALLATTITELEPTTIVQTATYLVVNAQPTSTSTLATSIAAMSASTSARPQTSSTRSASQVTVQISTPSPVSLLPTSSVSVVSAQQTNASPATPQAPTSSIQGQQESGSFVVSPGTPPTPVGPTPASISSPLQTSQVQPSAASTVATTAVPDSANASSAFYSGPEITPSAAASPGGVSVAGGPSAVNEGPLSTRTFDDGLWHTTYALWNPAATPAAAI